MGFNDEGQPVYQIASKEIPITGEFTGYPKHIMVKWFMSMGYTLVSDTILKGTNVFRNNS
jgi:hypothetical protein